MQTFTGYEYIKIDIANQFGMDKETWDNRIAWVDSNLPVLELMSRQADEPILYDKAVMALRDAHDGVSTGFIMGLDATASGIQIMAALMGCTKTAREVNLTNTGRREDVYAKVGSQMGTDRTRIKKPVMTTFYGSKEQPKEVFGEDTPELAKFYKVLSQELPGAMECMEDMQGCWQPNALKHEWSLPDGHIASVKVMAAVDKKIEVDELNHATFTHRAYQNMPAITGLSLAANIVHSIDGYIVREMYRKAEDQEFDLLTIHDSFWASPNYMNNVRGNYVHILAEIADSDLLQNILNDITGRNGRIYKNLGNLSSLIKTSNYALS